MEVAESLIGRQRANSARRARRLKIFYRVNSLYAFHLTIAVKLLGDPSIAIRDSDSGPLT
jgi:hypothetical protein